MPAAAAITAAAAAMPASAVTGAVSTGASSTGASAGTSSAGASGAVFGITGALLYVALRNRGQIGEISGRGAAF